MYMVNDFREFRETEVNKARKVEILLSSHN